MEKIKKSGGKREGAGRKPKLEGVFEYITIEIREDFIKKIKSSDFQKGFLNDILIAYFGE